MLGRCITPLKYMYSNAKNNSLLVFLVLCYSLFEPTSGNLIKKIHLYNFLNILYLFKAFL